VKFLPQFGIAETADEASALADVLDFPLLIRPSYVGWSRNENCD
jgi:carbamoylphosphate synthase large subunit